MNSDEVNYPPANDNEFWLRVSELSLNLIWDNPEDDIYEELLNADVSIPKQP